tara:strand:+ start:91 stop:258 length:168 start_codon:yes stop_codon:yes gene_type:complete
MKRHGKTLPTLRDGHPRRMSDARNAWKKMSDDQRAAFLAEINATITEAPKAANGD